MAGILPKPVVLYCVGCFNPITNKHLRLMGELLSSSGGGSSQSVITSVCITFSAGLPTSRL